MTGHTEKNSNEPSSISPIDQSVVWQGTPSTPDVISATINRAAAAQKSWSRHDLDHRAEIARRYATYLGIHRAEIESLLVREVGKLRHEATSEVNTSIAKIDNSVLAIQERRVPECNSIVDGTRQINYRPLGVVLVLGPFNFPLHLPGGQIIPALLAGNAIVFKPSERATAVGQWMVQAWHQCGLPSDVLQIVTGGPEVAEAAVDSVQIRGVFLTGSRHAALALRRLLVDRYDVQLAMELGGNNPIVVEGGVLPEIAANVVTHSAFVSSGQRCTCARRAIIIDSPQAMSQIKAIVNRATSLSIGLPNEVPSPDLGPLISTSAVDAIVNTYQTLLERGCVSLLAPRRSLTNSCLVGPAIVDASALSSDEFFAIGDQEWFGPLLVIRRVDGFQSAIDAARATPYGLAAALLGGDRWMFDEFAREVGAGVVNWNRGTTGAAATQPFGGLGLSGNHQPAGFFAIDSCSDPVASLALDQLSTDDPWEAA